MPRPSRAMSITPCPAPKQPPYAASSPAAALSTEGIVTRAAADSAVPCRGVADAAGPGCGGDGTRPAAPRPGGEQHQGRHDRFEGGGGQDEQQDGSNGAAEQAGGEQRAQPSTLAGELAAVAQSAAEAAGHQAGGVGGASDQRRYAKREQGGKADQRARADHSVDRPGGDARPAARPRPPRAPHAHRRTCDVRTSSPAHIRPRDDARRRRRRTWVLRPPRVPPAVVKAQIDPGATGRSSTAKASWRTCAGVALDCCGCQCCGGAQHHG